jgi:PKD repeat protein
VPISALGCRGPAETVTLTVEPTITAVANNTLPTICSNSLTDITLSSPSVPSAGNIVFNITAVASSPNISGYIPALNFLPQGYVIADFLVNSGNTAETVTYTITPVASGGASGAGCTGNSIVEVVTVDPLPIITPGQFDVVCSNTATNYSIITLNNLAGTTFTWPAPTLSDTGLSGGTARGTGSSAPITDTFINTTGMRQSATYDITPVGPSGCAGSLVQLTVFIDPLPDGTIAIDNPVVCMNGSAILNFTMSVGVAPFEIVYSDGTTDFTVSNIANSHFIAVNNLTATTTYTLKSIQDVNGCIDNIANQSVTVTVENPVADFTPDITNDCTPLVVTFTNNDIKAGTQYEWNWGDGSPLEISNSPTVSHTFINNSTVSDISYNVMLTAQRTNGTVVCTNTTTEFVTIKAGVNLVVNTATTEGCSPLLVTFENNSTGVLANKWFWREKGTTDENDVTNTFFATFVLSNTTTAAQTIEVVYQGDRNGCNDEIITEVTVYPELVADFSVAPGNNISITNPTITITNNTLNKNSWTHMWEWGDGQTTTAVDPGSHTYATFGQFEVKLTITDNAGNCTSEKIEVITVEPVLPEVDFTVDITEGCRALTVNFTNLSTSVDPDTYLWEFRNERGVLVGTSNLENPSFTFFDAGVINVTLSGSNPLGVTDVETKLSLIEVYELPTASFTVTPETVFLPDQLLFTSNLSVLADAFEWDFNGDGDIDSEEFEPKYKYESAGVYDISLVAINTATTCRDTLSLEKAVKVIEGGTADIPNGFFPGSGGGTGGNPGGPNGSGAPNSVFLPRVKGVRDDGFNMQIFDRWGHLIFESTDKTVGWNGRDLRGKLYPVGVYVYKLELVYVSGQQTTVLGDVTLIR